MEALLFVTKRNILLHKVSLSNLNYLYLTIHNNTNQGDSMKLITAQNANSMTRTVIDIQRNVELSELQGPVAKAGGLLFEIMESVISSIN